MLQHSGQRPPRFLRGSTDLSHVVDIATPPPKTLLRRIGAQTEMAKFCLDLGIAFEQRTQLGSHEDAIGRCRRICVHDFPLKIGNRRRADHRSEVVAPGAPTLARSGR